MADFDVQKDSLTFSAKCVGVQLFILAYMLFTKMDYAENTTMSTPSYVMFIDVSIMIFFGFGFLMTFLRRNGYTAVGLCVIVSAIVVQFSIVVEDALRRTGNLDGGQWGTVSLFSLINGLFCAGAVMISMGAVLGKVSPFQLLLMGLIETVLYWINFALYTTKIGAQDAAGGIVLHAFGAYFGLVVAKSVSTKRSLDDHESNSTIVSSNLFSLAGTLFLWLLWPSFCAAVAPSEDASFWAVCNTFLALIGSVMGFAIMTRLLHGGKFDVTECQNATLAGGVAMGVPAIYPMGPAQAMIVGLVAGILSTVGYAKVDLASIGINDTCGVNNLHGMPGLLSGLVGLLYYSTGPQVIGMVVTLAIAGGGGFLTGFVINIFPGLDGDQLFGDEAFWDIPGDYKIQ